jgi:heme-degrading monooxygenase HmoA
LIARIWSGAVRNESADQYAEHMRELALPDYAHVPGNRLVVMLRRPVPVGEEFTLVTLWDSIEAMKAFAGDDYERAKFYPPIDDLLVERGEMVNHYTVFATAKLDAADRGFGYAT